MARTVKFEGRTISVPDDATDDEVSQIIEASSAPAPASTPAPSKPLGKAIPLTIAEQAASANEKLMSGIGGMFPDWAPSRQDIVNTAAGASAVGGAFKNAPRIQNVADTESDAFTVGQFLDPVTAVAGGKAFQAATMLPKVAQLGNWAKNVIGGGASGATVAVPTAARQAITPEETGAEDTLTGGTLMGAGVGGLMGPAGRLINWPIKKAQRIAGGARGAVIDKLQDMFGDRAPQVIANLRALRGYVSGEMPTAGRAATPSSPELKALEEWSRAQPGAHRFTERDALNEAARSRPLENIAMEGRPTTTPVTGERGLSQAEQLRRDVTSPMFEAAKNQIVTVSPELQLMMSGPEVLPAIEAAQRTFTQKAANAIAQGRIPPITSRPGEHSIDILQMVKKNLDDLIEGHLIKGDKIKANQLKEVRLKLNDEMQDLSKNYGEGVQKFRELSEPQNRADVAEHLLKVSRSPSGAAEKAEAYVAALKNPAAVLKNTDVLPNVATIEQVFATAPRQLRDIKNIRKSMEREAGYAQLPQSKSMLPSDPNPFKEVEQAMPPVFSQGITTLRRLFKQFAGLSDEKVNKLVTDAMFDPKMLADLMSGVPPEKRVATLNLLRETMGNPQLYGGVVGQTVSPKE